MPLQRVIQVELIQNPEPDKKKDDKWNFLDILKTFVPLLGIFSAFCYILGRYYLEAYYKALGITPSALSLTTNDYMFFSIAVIILCLFVVLVFFLYWEWSSTGKSWLRWVLNESKGNGGVNQRKKDKSKWLFRLNLWTILAVVFVLIVVLCIVSISIFSMSDNNINGENNWIVSTGSVIILIAALILSCEFFSWLSPKVSGGKPIGDAPGFRVISAILIAVIIFILTIIPVNSIAGSQANSDERNAPWARVISTDNFSSVICADQSIANNYLDGKLLFTNNGNTYLEIKYRVPKDSTEKVIKYSADYPLQSPDDIEYQQANTKTIEKIQIYAIPVTSIRDIIYLPDYTKKE
jgi:hypothetical protein